MNSSSVANDHMIEAKVVILGDTGVGKTSLVLQYVENRFSVMSSPTIGASFLSKTLWIDGVRVRLQLWDTAGQVSLKAPMYYRGAAAALLVYDVTSKESYKKAKEWVKVVVGNQKDKPGKAVESAEAAEYAASIGAHFFETSAKKNLGVEDVFVSIAKQLANSKSGQTGSLNNKFKEREVQHETCPC